MMRIKMIIEFDFDPETGEYTPVSREIVDSTKTLATKSEKKKPSSKPELVSNEASLLLDDNKYSKELSEKNMYEIANYLINTNLSLFHY